MLLHFVLVFYQQNLDTIFLFSILPYILDFFNVLSYPAYLDEGIRKSKSLYNNLEDTICLRIYYTIH